MVPVERIELPTFGLQNRCSTAELNRLKAIDRICVGVNRRIPAKPLSGRGVATRLGDHAVRAGTGAVRQTFKGRVSHGKRISTAAHARNQSAARCDDDPDLQSLRQENARLRELVVRLSSLVIETIADQK
jgi:hypothetical protein